MDNNQSYYKYSYLSVAVMLQKNAIHEPSFEHEKMAYLKSPKRVGYAIQ